ncbi:hypothetical protein L9F63_019967, partial [Diploptera punctata]
KTYLNGKLLTVNDDGAISTITPREFQMFPEAKYILPPTSIVFWELPYVMAYSCLSAETYSDIGKFMWPPDQVYFEPISYRNVENEAKDIRRMDSETLMDSENRSTFMNYSGISSTENKVTDFYTNITQNNSLNKKNEIRVNENESNKNIQLREKRYVKENGYVIPGLEPDVFQHPLQKTSINKLQRRDHVDIYTKFRRLLKDRDLQTPKNVHRYQERSSETSSEENAHSFPTGEIYFKQHKKTSEERNQDNDYIDSNYVYEEEEPVFIDLKYYHAPGEYFENLKLSKAIPDEKFAGYGGELWEAETHALMRSHKMNNEKKDTDNINGKMSQEVAEGKNKKEINITIKHDNSNELDKKHIIGEQRSEGEKQAYERKINSIENSNKRHRKAKVMQTFTTETVEEEEEGNILRDNNKITTISSVQEIDKIREKENIWTNKDYFKEEPDRNTKTIQYVAKSKNKRHRINNGQGRDSNQHRRSHKMSQEDINMSQNEKIGKLKKTSYNSGYSIEENSTSDVSEEYHNKIKDYQSERTKINEKIKNSSQINNFRKNHSVSKSKYGGEQSRTEHAIIGNEPVSLKDESPSESYHKKSSRRMRIIPIYDDDDDEVYNTQEIFDNLQKVETVRKSPRSYRHRRLQRDINEDVTDENVDESNLNEAVNKNSPFNSELSTVVKYDPKGNNMKFEEKSVTMKNNKLMIQNSGESSYEHEESKENEINVGSNRNDNAAEVCDSIYCEMSELGELNSHSSLEKSNENHIDMTKNNVHIKREFMNLSTGEETANILEVSTLLGNNLKLVSKGDNDEMSAKMPNNNSNDNTRVDEETDRKSADLQNVDEIKKMVEIQVNDNPESVEKTNVSNYQSINKEDEETTTLVQNLKESRSHDSVHSFAVSSEKQLSDTSLHYKIADDNQESNIELLKDKSGKTEMFQYSKAFSDILDFMLRSDEVKSEENEHYNSVASAMSNEKTAINRGTSKSDINIPTHTEIELNGTNVNENTKQETAMDILNVIRPQREIMQEYNSEYIVAADGIPMEKELQSTLNSTEKIIENTMEIGKLGLGLSSKLSNIAANSSLVIPSSLDTAGKIIEKALSIGKLGLTLAPSTNNISVSRIPPTLNLTGRIVDNLSYLKPKSKFIKRLDDIKTQNEQSQSFQALSLEMPRKMVGRKFPSKDGIKDNINSVVNNLSSAVKKEKIFTKNRNAENKVGKFQMSYNVLNNSNTEILEQNNDNGNKTEDESNHEVSDIMNKDIQERDGKEDKEVLGGTEVVRHSEKVKNISASSKNKYLFVSDIMKNNFEDLNSIEISNEENTSDPLIRKAKDVKHIAAGNLNIDIMDNARNFENVKLSALNSRNLMRAQLERKRLETLNVLEAYKTKLREDLIRKNAELLKFRTASHIINRRSIISNDDNGRDDISNEGIIKNFQMNLFLYPQSLFPDPGNWWHFIGSPFRNQKKTQQSEFQFTTRIMSYPRSINDSSLNDTKNSNLSSTYVLGSLNVSFPTMFKTRYSMYPKYKIEETSHLRQAKALFNDTNSNSKNEDITGSDTRNKSEEHYVQIRQLSLPVFRRRTVIPQDPILSNMPLNENDIKLFYAPKEVKKDSNENYIKIPVKPQLYTKSTMNNLIHANSMPMALPLHDEKSDPNLLRSADKTKEGAFDSATETLNTKRIKRSISLDADDDFTNNVLNSFSEELKDNWVKNNIHEKYKFQAQENYNGMKLSDPLNVEKLNDNNENNIKRMESDQIVNITNEVNEHFWGSNNKNKFNGININNGLISKDVGTDDIKGIPFGIHKHPSNNKKKFNSFDNLQNDYNTSSNVKVLPPQNNSEKYESGENSSSLNVNRSNNSMSSIMRETVSNEREGTNSLNLIPQHFLHVSYVAEGIADKMTSEPLQLNTHNNSSVDYVNDSYDGFVEYLPQNKVTIPGGVKVFFNVTDYREHPDHIVMNSENSTSSETSMEESDDGKIQPTVSTNSEKMKRIIQIITKYITDFFHKIGL